MINLLNQAISKQLELNDNPRWKDELLPFAPPILWFGDLRSKLPKIVTLGANPSRREFLVGAKVNPVDYKNYLNGWQRRIYIFKTPFSKLASLSENTLEEVIESYNAYFSNNVYAAWFGLENGGKVEAFMNGLRASLYNNNNAYRGIHIDLFPFATMSDFKEIQRLCNETLFQTGWAQTFLENLISKIEPIKIIVFGMSNYSRLHDVFSLNEINPEVFCINGKNCKVYFNNLKYGLIDIPLVGLSINLGNPHGWSREELIQLGNSIY